MDTLGLMLAFTDIIGNPRFIRNLDIGAYESLLVPTLAPVVIISVCL